MRGNRTPKTTASPLWLGSGFHYALEDFHGYKKYPSASIAFRAYLDAYRRSRHLSLPDSWEEDTALACSMLEYYENVWLCYRNPLETYWHEGVPQCEVHFEIDLTEHIDSDYLAACEYDRLVYRGIFDRIIVDEYDRLWIVEYKTAKSFEVNHLLTDSQVSAYCWAASVLYDKEIAGVIYQQHKKDTAEPPKLLKTGKFSVNKQQNVTHGLYRAALLRQYGTVDRAPKENIDFLNWLVEQESPEQDRFVRRDLAERNEHQIAAEGTKILMEAMDMINPDLPLYPNPTRDCSWDCQMQSPCISLDDGSDWEHELEDTTTSREEGNDSWKNQLRPWEELEHLHPLLPQ